MARGWRWQEEEEGTKYEGPQYEIPDSIQDVSDDLPNQILICEHTQKPYRITKEELKFYRDMSLPIPRTCTKERHLARIALRNPRVLYDRECGKCRKAIQTTYSPARPEKVYCESCYLNAVA